MLKDATSLNKIIYHFLVNQIEFGVYHFGDSLPSIKETSLWFLVSQDTVRCAYLQLKQKGFITLTKKAGATVVVQYNTQEIEQHIQTFFALRKDAIIDLCYALEPMFSYIQWFALKNISLKQLEVLEHLCENQTILPTYKMIQQVQLIYSTLHNDLLFRLVWQAFMFFQGPFLSLPQNRKILEVRNSFFLSMIDLCRQKDWNELWHIIKKFQTQISFAIFQFYENRITLNPDGEPISFYWNAYEKSSQHRYSLAIELLKDIRYGIYLEGTFLPSPTKLAQTKQVSVITIRRTLELLNLLGATQSINGIGTQVLKTEDSTKHCDFSQPILQKRLFDFAQSLQILVLTCKRAVKITLIVMKEPHIQQWKEFLLTLKRVNQHESVVFGSLEIISQFAPIELIRKIYAQLLQILLWGYPLRGMHGSKSVVNKFYLPYIDSFIDCLVRHDEIELGFKLEELLCYEFEFVVTHLKKLGISQVANLIIPK